MDFGVSFVLFFLALGLGFFQGGIRRVLMPLQTLDFLNGNLGFGLSCIYLPDAPPAGLLRVEQSHQM